MPSSPGPGATAPDEVTHVLDMVLLDWLKQGPDMRTDRDMNQAIVLMRPNLPNGYYPKVTGRRILVADQFVAKRSSYKQIVNSYKQIVKLEQGTRWVVSTEGNDNIGPHCLQIGKIEIRGDTGRVEISQNRRFNLGGSGGLYVLTRTDIGWTVKLTEVWKS